jgi:hypothetical protein
MGELLSKAQLTGFLTHWQQPGAKEGDQALSVAIQRELRRIAGAYMRRERRDPTLQPTALVNEAYLLSWTRTSRGRAARTSSGSRRA